MAAGTSFTDTQSGFEVLAHINDLRELFVPPVPDPLCGRVRSTSVVDEVVAHLRSRSLRRATSIRLAISLPPDGHHHHSPEEVQAAIRSYAVAKARETEESLRINRYEGLARMPRGAVVAVAMLLLVIGVYALLPHPVKPILNVTTPFLTVLVWVAIWIPVEYLLYESWSLKRLRTAYLALSGVVVTGHWESARIS